MDLSADVVAESMKKIRRLEADEIRINDGKIDLGKYGFGEFN